MSVQRSLAFMGCWSGRPTRMPLLKPRTGHCTLSELPISLIGHWWTDNVEHCAVSYWDSCFKLMVRIEFDGNSINPVARIVAILNTPLTSNHYITKLRDLHPSLDSIYRKIDGLFQHRVQAAPMWFEKQSSNFQRMTWLPSSLGINQIEHLWAWWIKSIREQHPTLTNIMRLSIDRWHGSNPFRSLLTTFGIDLLQLVWRYIVLRDTKHLSSTFGTSV